MLKSPGLYVVATPIGNLGDISARAIETLRNVDCIAAEDTRHSRKLLEHFAIHTPIVSLHDHNEPKCSELLLRQLQQNKTIALICDAGTPLISDPGYKFIRKARQHKIFVTPIPGPCACITALSVSGMDCRRFVFEGFLPEKKIARQKKLKNLLHEVRTLVFYEAPHRILDFLEDLLQIFGPARKIVIARELTKAFETILEGSVEQLRTWLDADKNQQRGEFVVLVKGSEQVVSPAALETKRILELLLEELPIKQAASLTARITHEKKNKLYAQALALTGKTA